MTKLSRRAFLQRTVGVGAGAVLMLYSDGSYKLTFAQAGTPVYSLRVVHTNDHHARIEPQALSDAVTLRSTPTPAVTRLFGGVSRRKTLFDQYRAESTAAGQNVLFLDAGDVFQGTLYFNLFQGQADLDFYIDLGYDAMTIGNHEFDRGPQPLVDFMKGLHDANGTITKPNNIPMVSANITATDAVLAPVLTAGEAVAGTNIGAYKIIDRGGKKIGIFGLTTPETQISSSPGPGITFGDPIAVATTMVPLLKSLGADYIIALTHIGYGTTPQDPGSVSVGSDLDLAAKVDGIDLIVGGHSHTPLLPTNIPLLPDGTPQISLPGVTPVGPYATVATSPSGKPTLIVTDWEWGKWIGDITIGFDATGAVSQIAGTVHQVWADILPVPASGQPPRALIPGEQPEVTPDAGFLAREKPYTDAVNALGKAKIGETSFLIQGGSSNGYRTRETTGGDIICDAILARAKAFAFPDGKAPDVAITNSGGIRAEIRPGDVTVGSVITVLPFGNTIATVDLTGAQIIAALENGVSQVSANAGRFPQVAGLRFFWNKGGTAAVQLGEVPANTKAVKGSRIQRVDIQAADGTYSPINLTTVYRVVTNNFMVLGGDGYFVFTKAGDKSGANVGGGTGQYDTQLIMADAVQDYIAARTPLQLPTQGRILGVYAMLPIVTNTAITAAVPVQ